MKIDKLYSRKIQVIIVVYLLIISYVNVLKWNKSFWMLLGIIFISLIYIRFILKTVPWENAVLNEKRVIRFAFSAFITLTINETLYFFVDFGRYPSTSYLFFVLPFVIYFTISEKYMEKAFKKGGILYR